nr:hypothetical protein [Tanacetum cinerariifolium]
MSAMANTTPIVTTVTKPTTNPSDADATPRVNIQDFREEYYEDLLPIIMEKVFRDKRKEVHARLDFEEGSRERRTREGSRHSSTRTPTARPERLKVQDRLRYNDRNVLDGLGKTSSRDHPRGRSRPHRLDASNKGRPENRERFRSVRELYDDSHSSNSYHNRDRSHHMKRRRASESPLSSVSRRAARVWFDELPPKSVDSYKDLKAAFLAYFIQQKKYAKDPVEIHNIKQKDGETIEDFMERFKVETGRMKGVPECMRIFRFMHGVNNLELTKRLNKDVPKTMEEMMITTTAFIRGEAAATSKNKGHTSQRTHDQSKSRSRKVPAAVTYGDPSKKENNNKFCDFHNDKGHNTDECMQLKRQIEELVRAGKLSHLIKEIKHGRHQSKPSDMTGVPRSLAEHRLNIREGYSPVQKKKKGQAPERAKAIQAEVQKFVEAGIMREVYYHDWLLVCV